MAAAKFSNATFKIPHLCFHGGAYPFVRLYFMVREVEALNDKIRKKETR
jgi:hypothetical protein